MGINSGLRHESRPTQRINMNTSISVYGQVPDTPSLGGAMAYLRIDNGDQPYHLGDVPAMAMPGLSYTYRRLTNRIHISLWVGHIYFIDLTSLMHRRVLFEASGAI